MIYYSIMKCPKCNVDITEEMLVCPNCKKVLKLVCPKCNTVNQKNTCKKCGFVIIAKCHQCGKINQTINGKCSKCGFSTHTSVAINSSNIDEFACLTIEFPNLSDIKSALGSTKLTEKFKTNLDNLIYNYTATAGIKREIIENAYIIRFNKDNTFKDSAINAAKAAIEIQNLITELNFKLNNLKGVVLQCNIAILKRDIYSKPEQYTSGFDIKLIYNNKKDFKLINCLQVITDASIYEQICDDFDLSSLSTTFVKNETVMFFELNLKKYIKIPKNKEEEKAPELAKLNIFEENLEMHVDTKEDLYDVDAINFNELKCTFTKTKAINVIQEVVESFKNNRKRIVSIKGDKELYPPSKELINQLENSKIFKNIFKITCYDEMKYKPYGFFHELISCVYNYSISPKNFNENKSDIFKEMDPSGFIKDLINLTQRQFPHPEDIRYSLFDIFFDIFHLMSQSLIYIENFEKIDDTSHEVLQLFFEQFKNIGLSYVIATNKDAQVHKNAHFLLSNTDYMEITIKPTPFKEIIEKNITKYENILDSYYIKKIAQNTQGSILYFNNAVEYLLEKELLSIEKGSFSVERFENIIIPATLEELIEKRLKNLEKDVEAFKTLGMLLLTAPMIDSLTLNLVQSNPRIIQKLVDNNYIYTFNNKIYIQNYNLIREQFINSTSKELQEEIAKEVLNKVFASEVKHPMDAVIYKILRQEKQEFLIWERLSHLNASLGDFSAYLNCSIKFLKLLDNYVNEDSQKTIEEYKMEVYENISNLLYKYKPNEINNIARVILDNLEQTNDKKVIELCNKMLQGCLIGGNYSHALELTHKILSKFAGSSISPLDENFNKSFFLVSLVKIEVLFSIGDFRNCIESGEEILNVITKDNLEQLMPGNLSLKQFEEVVLDAMAFVAISKVILLKDDSDLEAFCQKVKNNLGKLPKVFELFLLMNKLIKGINVDPPVLEEVEDNKFFTTALNFVKAFSERNVDYKKFADNIYQAKISSKLNKLSQIELICDLLIGFSYFMLEQDNKASSIYYSVLETSMKNGLKMITYLDWYFISMLKFKQQDFDVAFGIANNAIVQLEKDPNAGNFLFYLFMILLSKILIAKGERESAELCLNNAKFIKDKYGLLFEIGEPS